MFTYAVVITVPLVGSLRWLAHVLLVKHLVDTRPAEEWGRAANLIRAYPLRHLRRGSGSRRP